MSKEGKPTLRDWKRPVHVQKAIDDAYDGGEDSLPRSFHKHSITNLHEAGGAVNASAAANSMTSIKKPSSKGSGRASGRSRQQGYDERKSKNDSHKLRSRQQTQQQVSPRKWGQYEMPGMERRKIADEGAFAAGVEVTCASLLALSSTRTWCRNGS